MWKKIMLTAAFLCTPAFAVSYHFTLQGPENKTITERDFPNKYLLLAIGYTSCPDICPTTLYEIATLMKDKNFKEQHNVQPIFVSIDPLRDTPERLNQYVGFFDPRIIGLSGSLDAVTDFSKQLNASFGYRFNGKKVEPPNLPEGYTVYHTTYLYLISPERELIDVFDYSVGAKALAKGIDATLEKDRAEKKP